MTDDCWMMDFLENNDYHVSNAAKQCFETLEWRQKFGVNGEFGLYLANFEKILRCCLDWGN